MFYNPYFVVHNMNIGVKFRRCFHKNTFQAVYLLPFKTIGRYSVPKRMLMHSSTWETSAQVFPMKVRSRQSRRLLKSSKPC